MRNAGSFALALFAALSLVAAAPAVAAPRWQGPRADGPARAGVEPGAGSPGFWLACAAGGAGELIFTGNGATFDRARPHTAVVSVDGLARMFQTRAVPGAQAGTDDFVFAAPFAALQPLVDALKKGSEAEISLPSGHVRLPLTGSGRALKALEARCR